MAKTKKDDEDYKEYQRYIKSKEFKLIKTKVLVRDGFRCKCCGYGLEDIEEDKAKGKKPRTLQAHHSTYRHLYCELNYLDDLITLCNVCHVNIHRAPSNLRRFTRNKTEEKNNDK